MELDGVGRFQEIDKLHRELVQSLVATDKENLGSRNGLVQNVNRQLLAAGFAEIPVASLESGQGDVRNACLQCTQRLKKVLGTLADNDDKLQGAQDRLRQGRAESEDAHHKLQAAKASYEKKGYKQVELQSRLKECEQNLRSASRHSKTQIAELHRAVADLADKDSRVRTEMRKEEIAHEKIRERLHMLTSRRARHVSRAGPTRPDTKAVLPDRHSDLVAGFQKRHELLLAENDQLRAHLASVVTTMDQMLAIEGTEPEPPVQHLMNLPFGPVRDEVEAGLLVRARRLGQVWRRAGVSVPVSPAPNGSGGSDVSAGTEAVEYGGNASPAGSAEPGPVSNEEAPSPPPCDRENVAIAIGHKEAPEQSTDARTEQHERI